MSTSLPDPAACLPHGPGFRFVSRMESCEPGVSGVALWDLSGAEPFFRDHFPGRPLLPGVLLIEALAQASGLVAFSAGSGRPAAGLASAEVRLTRPVAPPAQVRLESKLTRRVGPLVFFEVRAMVNGAVAAKGELSLVEAV